MPSGQNILDWQINTCNEVIPSCKISIVTGFKSNKFKKKYKNVTFVKSKWKNTKQVDSFIIPKFNNPKNLLSFYGDTVFQKIC